MEEEAAQAREYAMTWKTAAIVLALILAAVLIAAAVVVADLTKLGQSLL